MGAKGLIKPFTLGSDQHEKSPYKFIYCSRGSSDCLSTR